MHLKDNIRALESFNFGAFRAFANCMLASKE